MKGLREYIRKHGNHFTEELALDVAGKKWGSDEVTKAAQKLVYYNVTDSTLGDMVFIMNCHRAAPSSKGKSDCVKYMVSIIGYYGFYGGKVFDRWVRVVRKSNPHFDFTPYI